MIATEVPAAAWLLGALLAMGLGSAWVARVSEGSPRQTSCQGIFCGFLVLVAAATMAAMGLGPGCWLASGGTFSLMVLTVVCDFSASRHGPVPECERGEVHALGRRLIRGGNGCQLHHCPATVQRSRQRPIEAGAPGRLMGNRPPI